MQATGINLSAFGSTRRPTVAIARLDGDDVHIALHPADMFARSKLSDPAADTFARWRTGLLELPRPIGVDVALDAAGIGSQESGIGLLWELTYRPIDFAFYGDAPLTDKIGEFGVRFRAMLAAGGLEPGRDLLEAHPRATVELLEFKGQYTGGGAHHGHNGWKADDKNQRADKLLARLFQELGVNPAQGAEKLTSDDLDAILCALSALAHARGESLLAGKALNTEIAERCARRANTEASQAHKAPAHTAILAKPYWATIALTRAST